MPFKTLLGWHLCRTKLPRIKFELQNKSEMKSETQSLQNASNCPGNVLKPVQLPKSEVSKRVGGRRPTTPKTQQKLSLRIMFSYS